MGATFAQTDPVTAESEATAVLEEFSSARIRGEGAEGFSAAPAGRHMGHSTRSRCCTPRPPAPPMSDPRSSSSVVQFGLTATWSSR